MKKSVLVTLILAVGLAQGASADVFKCKVNGRTVYQSAPCAAVEDDAGKIKVHVNTPEEDQAAEMKRREIEAGLQQRKLDDAEAARRYSEAAMNRAIADRALNDINAQQRQLDIDAANAAAERRESAARARYWDSRSGVDPTSRAGWR